MSALLDEVDQEIESRRKASEVAEQDVVANGNIVKSQEEEQPTVKVLGMEMTASCEGGKKWSRPDSPVLPSASPPSQEPVEPPQEIFLEGTLPAQSHLLVADAATEAQKPSSEEDPAIVLAGKMTLSVISLDSSENGTDESSNSGGRKQEERSSSNISEEFEKIEADINLQDQIDDIIGEAQNISTEVQKSEEFDLLQEIENDIKEITSKNIIAQLEHLGESIEIQNVEDQIIAQHLDNYLPISEIGREFLEKETFETVQQQLEKEIDENITESLAEEQLPEIQQVKAEENDVVESGIKEQENVKEIIQDEITAELTTDKIEEHAIENKISQQEVTRLEEEIKPAQKSLGDIIDESPVDINQEKEQVAVVEKEVAANEINAETEAQEKIQTITLEKEAAAEKQPENVISDHTVQNLAPTEDEIGNKEIAQLENKTSVVNHSEITSPGSAIQSNIIEEKKLIGEPQSEKVELPVSEELSELAEKEIVSEGKSSEILTGEQCSNIKQEPVVAQVAEAIKKVEENESAQEKIQQIESVQDIPAEEQETFNKLNEAISDLSSEFRRTEEEKPVERLVDNDESPIDLEDEEEEIEYEYEVSDDEAVDVDIGNVDRIGELADEQSVNRLNGDDQEQSKYVTTSSATLAENEISDDEDVEVEEIIEYVTDDEEEVDEVVQPGERNNVNHVNDRSNAHE
ncbi:hypothetical protein NQ314_002908 [Rhamnusium bicolor]|uniref:Uncharacterized protein n=1 Tax=Rhamnusium bicolor TaxID=1586634 RepID=A0AAV8ZQG7_9CUCU|nr:hypothetical protein NQ314_002908 [Rhamnusium bicolor]